MTPATILTSPNKPRGTPKPIITPLLESLVGNEGVTTLFFEPVGDIVEAMFTSKIEIQVKF